MNVRAILLFILISGLLTTAGHGQNLPTGGHWTPGSEDNTVFHPDVENATGLEMQIFNRLGHKVFETDEVFVGWDGYINSSYLAEQGVYIYRATITYSDGSQEKISGDLTFLH